MMARIGVMRALNLHVERLFDSSRKEKHSEPKPRAQCLTAATIKYKQ
jgi:hypothetical protein